MRINQSDVLPTQPSNPLTPRKRSPNVPALSHSLSTERFPPSLRTLILSWPTRIRSLEDRGACHLSPTGKKRASSPVPKPGWLRGTPVNNIAPFRTTTDEKAAAPISQRDKHSPFSSLAFSASCLDWNQRRRQRWQNVILMWEFLFHKINDLYAIYLVYDEIKNINSKGVKFILLCKIYCMIYCIYF